MSYKYGKSSDYLARLEHQRKIAEAELAHKERELQAIRDAEYALARINHKRRVLTDQLVDATTKPRPLPPPIHGGRKGLLEATKEANEWMRNRKRQNA